MSTTLDTPSTAPVAPGRPAPPVVTVAKDEAPARRHAPAADQAITPSSRRFVVLGLLGLRLAVGFEFLWAFLDKTFGFGYATSSAHAWIHGGSPTSGFLSGVNAGPFQGFFNGISGVAAIDWLFMLGLLGVGVALILGAALRPAAIAGATMLLMMYAASWPFATHAGGQATHSVNPIVDDHIVSTLALVVIGALAAWSAGTISRRWSDLAFVRSHSSLR
jgi:thiosulfate dehydrogenase [quinone] large subunit